MKTTISITALALFLVSGCGDKPQGLGGIKSDNAPYTGVGTSQYATPGWKAGDKTSWERQLRTRAQGQNDYATSN